MPAISHLSPVRVVFASGNAELNRAMLAHFAALEPGIPLCVVAEFEPDFPGTNPGEWIAWHVQRTPQQNLNFVRAALAGRSIASAAVAYDRRSGLSGLRDAARLLAPGILTAYDEDMRVTPPRGMRRFLLRRAIRAAAMQLRSGGRTRNWLRRIAHPGEAEIPLRARAAQARGLAAGRLRGTRVEVPLAPKAAQSEGVSVVIPSRDGLALLREMLRSLMPQISRGEVIVVDNGSTDGTVEWLAREHPGIRVFHHAEPLSFARAVNAGIRESRFAHTLLLNNDMIAAPEFVNALEEAFQRVPDLFCATAQIVFPPGMRREETGKAVWRRDTPGGFPVRCDEPALGEDLTWVLYGSGGCSLFDTAKLAALGGVSELYDPAYVEDLDLGFRAWRYGWPSVYCARAQVEHRHRSTTSRFYSERQIRFFVERNYLRFVGSALADSAIFEHLWTEGIRRLQLLAMQGHAASLDALRAIPRIAPKPPAASGHLTEEEIFALGNGDVAVFPGCAETDRPKILIASPYLPYPLSHGGAVRIYNLMKHAAGGNSLVLMAFCDELTPPPAELLAICTEIVLVRRHGTHYRRETARPDTVEEFSSDTFRASLKQAVHQWRPAIVQLEFTWMAQYANACHPARTILTEHDVTFDLQQQLLATAPSTGTARLELAQQLDKWKTFETAAWSAVDCVVTMSGKDTQAITGARSVECLPNGVDCSRFQPEDEEPEPNRLLLIGSFAHLPNLLALDFFLREVWPHLAPDCTLHVIGGPRPNYYLDYFHDRVSMNLAQRGVEVEGFVADVRSAYRRAAIVLAPLTASAGTNIKVLEAMAMGKVVVGTPAGFNGLEITPDHDVLMANEGIAMAERISGILKDHDRRKTLERNARTTALRYDWGDIATRQEALYDRLRG